jgi:hypothetical protein
MLRDALSAGEAVDEGKALLDGRTVERIRLGGRCATCPNMPTYAYVDPQTFDPIETDGPVVFQVPGRPAATLHSVTHVLTYEYLPTTAANLALTNIRAQHPNASIWPGHVSG